MNLIVFFLAVFITHKHQVLSVPVLDITSIPTAIGGAGIESINQLNNALNELAGMIIALPLSFSEKLGTVVGNIAAEISSFPAAIKNGPLGAIFLGIFKFMTTLQDGVMGMLRNAITSATQQATALITSAAEAILVSGASINATLSTVTAEIDAAIAATPAKIICLTGLQQNVTAAAATAFSGLGSCVSDKINKAVSALASIQSVVGVTAGSLGGSMATLQECVKKVNAADNIIKKIATSACLAPASASLVFGNLAELSSQISKTLTTITGSIEKLQTDIAVCNSLNTFTIPSISSSIAMC